MARKHENLKLQFCWGTSWVPGNGVWNRSNGQFFRNLPILPQTLIFPNNYLTYII